MSPAALRGLATVLLLLVPGALVIALAFRAGGFFPGPPALAAVVLAVLLVLRLTLASRPLAGLGRAYVAGAGLLGLLAAWTFVSSAWSNAPGRALVEYDRTLLYLLTFALVGSVGRSPARVRWLVRGLLVALFVVCAAAFITRTLPELWRTSPNIAAERLSYPLTYWNALGIMAALGAILGFSVSSDLRERPFIRVIGAAVLPVFAATLVLTLSRGAIAAGAVGVLAVVAVSRSSGVLSTLVCALPAAFTVKAAYAAELLTNDRPTADAAVAQGLDLAVKVAVASVVAALLRAALLRLDGRIPGLTGPRLARRPVWIPAAVVLLIGLPVAGAVAVTNSEDLSRQYNRFLEGDVVDEGNARGRLTNPANNGRIDQWRVALEGWRSDRLRGAGAGTYALMWDRARPQTYQVEDAHSVYVEMLAELGVVGLALLTGVVLLILGGFAWRARGPDRGPYAGLLAAGVAWALHAGIDWDWEMPATTIWFFAAGGLALAAADEGPASGRGDLPRTARVAAGIAVLVVAVTPLQMFVSEQARLDAARAFERGDCPRAVNRALDSLSALGSRPEPFAIVGYCDVGLGYPDLAVQAMENAVRRDPGNWEFHYGLALVRAAAGEDPREAAGRALSLNPRSPLAQEVVRRFATDDPQKWRRRAVEARLPRYE